MNNQTDAGKLFNTLRLIWFAQLASVALFLLLTFLVAPPAEAGDGYSASLLIAALAVVGLSNVAASFVVKRAMLARAVERQRPAAAQQAYIVAFALCESAALLGLVSYFTTGTNYYYGFFAAAALGLLAHRPSRDQLLAASFRLRG